MLIYDILSGRRGHIPRTETCDGVYEVGKVLGVLGRRGDHMDNPRGRCVSGVTTTLGGRVASLLEELRG